MSAPRLLRAGPILRASLGLALLAPIIGCSGGGDAPVVIGDPEPGGTAVVAVTSDFQTFNPIANTAVVTSEVINHMLFTPIIQFDENLEPIPALAESWELDEAGVTFRIRSDLTWHDGQPVTADDVLFSFELAKNPETASLIGSAYLTMIRSAQLVDPQTIRFDFTAPHSQAMQAFWWAPVPRHLLGSVAPAQLWQASFSREPVGNGPFRFASWESGQQLTLEANDAYPEALGGRPMLDRVVFRVVPEATTRLTELLTGAIDINHTLLPDEAMQVEGQRGVQVLRFPGREFLYLGLNNERPPFDDPLVRRAIAMGVDRESLVEALMSGYATLASGMIPEWSPVSPTVPPVSFDPEAARLLLQEAGWVAGADGMVQRNGQPLRFTLLSSEDRLRQDIAVVLQQQLRQIGVTVDVRAIEFQTLLQQHRNRDYEAVLSSWSLDTFRADPSPLFSCEQAQQPESPNRAGYCNPEADRLIAAGLTADSEARAQEIWGEFTRILQTEMPIVFLVWPEQLAGVYTRLQGVEMDVRGKFVSAPDWWIPSSQR